MSYSEVADIVERWDSFLKSQLREVTSERMGFYVIGYRIHFESGSVVCCCISVARMCESWNRVGSTSVPLISTPHHLLLEFLFLVLATVRWFEDLSPEWRASSGVVAVVPLN